MKLKGIKVEAADEESRTAFLGFDEGNNFIDSNENDDMHSPQTQSRWTPEDTRLMLELRFSRQAEFQQGLRQKKELWSEIADEMRGRGLCDSSLTAEGCNLKYRNMLQTYKKNRIKEDSGMQSVIVWEYYEMFKEALRTAEKADTQEGNESIEPSMLGGTVCYEQCDEMYGSEVVKVEMPPPSPKPAASSDIVDQPIVDAAANCATQENYAVITWNEIVSPILNIKSAKSETLSRPKRQRRSVCDTVSAPSVKTVAMEMPATEVAETPFHMQGEPDISSSSMSVPPPFTQPPVPIMHPNNMQTIPAPPLAPNEVRECQVFGESIGIQLINIHEPHTRAILRMKIQELLCLANVGVNIF